MVQSKEKNGFSTYVATSNAPFGFALLCIYTALVLIRPHEWPAFDIQFPILRIILIITFVVYVFSLRPKAWNTQCTLMVLLLLSMLLSEIRAFRYFSDLRFVIDWVNSNVIPFILYLGFLTTARRQKYILFISLFSSMILTLHAFDQMSDPAGQGWAEIAITRYDGPEPFKQARYIGIFNDPNDMGMFLVMNIAVAAIFLVKGNSNLKKVIWLAVIGWMLLGIYWTGSRGSLIGLLTVLAVVFYFKYGKVKSMILGFIAVPILAVVLTMFRSIGKDDESAQDRLTAWYEGIQMFKHRPLFGFGKDRFLEYHSKVAHNSYVTIMSELGVFGYLLWMTFLLLTIKMLLKVLDVKNDNSVLNEELRNEIVYARYLFIALFGYCSTAFFISRSYIMFFYMFAAIACATYARARSIAPELVKSVSAQEISKTFITSGLSLVGLYFLITLLLTI
ncbi:O-antigen ligase family protein [Alteromonas macleodii]|tara:strand:- start:23464 stop:24807 length:1344 start_codon:yes stop_codon:yes gene_type:complete